MKQIELVGGLFAIVDDEYYEVLSQDKWYVLGVTPGCLGYAHALPGKSSIAMHRLIACAKKKEVVDHINGNTLDNRKCNLRICTSSENAMNQRKRKVTLSKYKGLSKGKGRKKWFVQICVNGKKIGIGSFADEIEAAKAYDAAARKYHGEFAATNFEE